LDAFLATVESTAVAETLRQARWGYAALNATHILGICLVVGAILPLDLRLLGVWRSVPRANLVRVLAPVAVFGLALAVAAGLLLFSIRARQYAGTDIFQLKMAFVVTGTVAALVMHRANGFLLEDASDRRLAWHAILSMACWLGALICGRLIAFVNG
jgi:hypothetical protein